MLVEQRRDSMVGKALALHHVAPVACEVADGDEDQPVAGPGLPDELRAPFPPVHGVARMQPQVGRGRMRESVGLLVSGEYRGRSNAQDQRQAGDDRPRGAPPALR